MRAALPMYDYADESDASDALWDGVRDGFRLIGIDAPDRREKPVDVWELWRSPETVFAQTCGYPYVSELRDQVTLIGTPDYGVCEGLPGFYDSVLIARRDSRVGLEAFRGATFACNSVTSQSGCWAMMSTILQSFGEVQFFSEIAMTGSHANSVQAVLDEQADIAAIDAVSWMHICRALPEAAGLAVIDRTEPMPGLPFICASVQARPGMFEAVSLAVSQLSREHADALNLKGVVELGPRDYQIISRRADEAAQVYDLHFPASR